MRRFVFLAMIAGLTLAPLARPALAVTKTPFTATIALVTIIDPGHDWYRGDVYHLRGEIDEGTLTGDLEGSYTLVLNVDYNTKTLRGEAYGTLTLITPEVTWECASRSSLTDVISGSFAGRGNDGSEISGTSMGVIGEVPVTLEGSILEP